jgi:hypothetical protein
VSRPGRKARYRLISHPVVADDIEALAGYGAAVVAAARVALDDLAHGRVTGKELGMRRVSGDLTGLARVKFDVAGSEPPRFRILYADVDASTRGVLAIGVRDEHAIYRMAVERIAASEAAADQPGQDSPGEPEAV